VQLRMDGGREVPVVRDHDRYKEWIRLGEAKDAVGLQMMTDRGEMFWTSNGTKARILENRQIWDGSYDVRILDGPLYGQEVWTSGAFVKEDRPHNSKPSQTPTEHQGKPAEGGLAAGDKAIIYGSWLMATNEETNRELDYAASDPALMGRPELALKGNVLNCYPSGRPSIERTSVVILDDGTTVSGKVYRKVQITGVIRHEQGEWLRSAGFAEEDRSGSPEDCFFLEGEPPNVGYRWVNSIGSVGYIEQERLYPVDDEGHDLRFRNVKPDATR